MVDEAKNKILDQWNWGCEYLCTKTKLENNGDPPLQCRFIILEYIKLLLWKFEKMLKKIYLYY